MSNISGIVKSIQDIMRKGAGTYGDATDEEGITGDALLDFINNTLLNPQENALYSEAA